MSILLNENTRVMIQCITGKLARFHTSEMVDMERKLSRAWCLEVEKKLTHTRIQYS